MKKIISVFVIVSLIFLYVPQHTEAAPIYATFNPSDTGGTASLSNGNLTLSSTGTSWGGARTTVNVTSGKWYWEYTVGSTDAGAISSGIAQGTSTLADGLGGSGSNAWGYETDEGLGHGKYNGDGGISYGAAYYTPGDVVGIALDMDDGTITMYLNGVSQGTMYSNVGGTIFGGLVIYDTGTSVTANFGASPFAYTVPTGYNHGLYTLENLNCNSNTSPATCGAATAGTVAMATSSQTLVVNTTAVASTSEIFVIEDQSLGSRLGITCDTATGRIYSISARTPGASFTIKSSASPSTANPACLSYWITN